MSHSQVWAIAGAFFIPLIVLTAALYAGRAIGSFLKERRVTVPDFPVRAVAGSSFSLMAFLLGFTFSIAISHYSGRQQMLLQEVTKIRAVYLGAGLLAEPVRSDAHDLLVEYIGLRIGMAKNAIELDQALPRSHQIIDTLWGYIEDMPPQVRNSSENESFAASVIELADIYNQRVVVSLEYRIHPLAILILLFISCLAMLYCGFQFGATEAKRTWIALPLALIIAVVFFLIMATDRPELGVSRPDPRPMVTLQQQLYAK